MRLNASITLTICRTNGNDLIYALSLQRSTAQATRLHSVRGLVLIDLFHQLYTWNLLHISDSISPLQCTGPFGFGLSHTS